MLGAHTARVLARVVMMRFDVLRLDAVSMKAQHVSRLVVQPDGRAVPATARVPSKPAMAAPVDGAKKAA
jgi:hypothetical protein